MNLDFLKSIPIKEILGAIIGVAGYIWTWFEKNKGKIEAIVLRVEKDSQDGWTNEEKEKLVLDLFFQEVYPKLPWYIKMLPKSLWEKLVRKAIREICEKSHSLKLASAEIKK